MKVILLFLLLTVGSSAMAHEVTVGKTPIEIPAPIGFVRSTPEMTKLADLQKGFVPATNQQLAFYFIEADAPTALAGNLPSLTRRFAVQVPKSAINATITPEQFAELKSELRVESETEFERAEAIADFSEGSSAMSRVYDTQMLIKAGGVVPMAPHDEGERTISISSAMAFDVQTEGASRSEVVVVTSTYLLAKGKLLFLYVYGGPEDLEWTRAKSKEWADAILSANSSAAPIAATGGASPASATPATRALSQGLGGALSAFLVMLLLAGVASVFSARKKG